MTACVLSTALLLACCPLALAAEPDTDPLTAQELAQMTDEQIAALSQEQSDATLNKMAQLFQDGEKQALDEYLSALGFATTYEEYADQQRWNEEEVDTEPSIQPMWGSTDPDNPKAEKMCHERITTAGFLVYLGARNLVFNGGSSGFTLSDMQLLSSEVGRPDHSIQVGFFFAGHFYNPDTNTNYLGDSANTAKTNAQSYYDYAVKKYREGKRTEAIKNLSYCLHYIQDAGEPHHASNLLVGSSNHSEFEEEATKWLYDGTITYDLEENFDFTSAFYNGFISRSVGLSVYEIAVGAKGLINAAQSPTQGIRLLAAFFAIGNAMQYTSGILYKFATETHLI